MFLSHFRLCFAQQVKVTSSPGVGDSLKLRSSYLHDIWLCLSEETVLNYTNCKSDCLHLGILTLSPLDFRWHCHSWSCAGHAFSDKPTDQSYRNASWPCRRAAKIRDWCIHARCFVNLHRFSWALARTDIPQVRALLEGGCVLHGMLYLIPLSLTSSYVFDIKHFLSLPAFIFLGADVKQGIASLSSPTSSTPALTSYLILLVNLFTQLFCVSGVNRLSSVRHSIHPSDH